MKPPHLDDQTRGADEVVVYGRPGRHTVWHTDPDCRRFTRQSRSPVEIWATAAGIEYALRGYRRTPRAPCETCARPQLIDLAVREAVAAPSHAERVVLTCPRARLGQDGSHHRCAICASLRDLARRYDAASHVDSRGYTLVTLTVDERLRSAVTFRYAVHRVPAAAPAVTADLLAVAWATRDNGHPDRAAILASRESQDSPWFPHTRLNFTAAALVTSAPLPAGQPG